MNYSKDTVYEATMSGDFSGLETIYQKNQGKYLPMSDENPLVPRLLRTKERVRLKNTVTF